MEGQRLLQDIKQLKALGGLAEGVRVSWFTHRNKDLFDLFQDLCTFTCLYIHLCVYTLTSVHFSSELP